MYSLYGPEEIIKDVYRISSPFSGGAVKTTDDLHKCYLAFLADHQPYMPVNHNEDIFVVDPEKEAALVRAYSYGNGLNDLRQSEIIGEPFPDDLRQERIDFVRDALEQFLNLDEMLGVIFRLIINSIFIRPSNRLQGRAFYGGSSSAAIGVIWMSLGPAVTKADVMEMLLHELTHHLLFVDEHNYQHFTYPELIKKENYAFSAILNMMRPLDKVVHSIVVATELVKARTRFLHDVDARVVHQQSQKMSVDTMKACEKHLSNQERRERAQA